jgi:lipopolysaccharide export system protein LptA
MCKSTNRWEFDTIRRRLAAPVTCLALLFYMTVAAMAAETGGDRVRITADRLIAESRANSAEFIGQVRAVQGTTVITTDRLKIFYRAGANDTAANPPGDTNAGQGQAGAIEKLVCTGRVKIFFDDKVAVSEKAVYTADNGVLVLTGPETMVTSGKNSVSGEKVTVFRNEDRMVVDKGSNQRVEAILFSKGKGLK